MENDNNIIDRFRSQEDYLIDEMNAAEQEQAKWNAVCEREGHRIDHWNTCDICGKEFESSDLSAQAD